MIEGDRSVLQLNEIFGVHGDRFVFIGVNAYNRARFARLAP
jgi:hypothetical protein